MTSNTDYQTTATGSIDYAHYARIAHDIRSQDTWNAIAAIRAALAALLRRGAGNTAAPRSNAPDRAPMRTPRLRHARPVVPQSEANAAIR